MHILITGAGGFSGAQLATALLARGHRITAVTGSGRGRLPAEAEQLGQLNVIRGDLAGDLVLPDKIDAIVHAAARPPSPAATTDDLMHDNVLATRKLVLHARQSGVRKFVYFSSVSVYGRIESPVVDERTPIRDPDTYGLTKRIGEELLAAEEDSFCSLAMRLPGIVGPDSVRNWLTQVLVAAREGREIPVFNPDAPFNNAVHIADLVHFVLGALDREWKGADTVTLGAAGQIAVRDAVQLLVDAFGGRSFIRYATSSKGSFLISNARACDRYGYDPMKITEMMRRFASENRPAANAN